MSEDLKIEIRKLFALHEATVQLEHGARKIALTENPWKIFTPSRFVYAFFTFNSIYSFDWESSFDKQQVIRWQCDENGRYPGEEDQFTGYLKYVSNKLSPETPTIFARELKRILDLFHIAEPVATLEHVDLVNASKKLEELSKQLPKQFSIVLKGDQKDTDFYPSACLLLKFVYKVRCNLFHGVKTNVQLLDTKQQQRLLIYTALLIAANSLLFLVAKKSNIGWNEVSVDFDGSNGV
jgi:hypothetical protein